MTAVTSCDKPPRAGPAAPPLTHLPSEGTVTKTQERTVNKVRENKHKRGREGLDWLINNSSFIQNQLGLSATKHALHNEEFGIVAGSAHYKPCCRLKHSYLISKGSFSS